MELRLYWSIIRKRLGIVLALLGVVFVSYVAFQPTVASGYVAQMRFVVGVRPEPATDDYYRYDRYYTWLTAEYLVDDLAEVVKSQAFAGDVARLAGLEVPVGAIQGATSAGKLHRILQVSITWHDAAQLERIANAVVETLQTRGHVYFAQLATDEAAVAVIDPPTIHAVGASLRQRLDLPLRLLLALAAGVGLAFLLEYLDDSVRGRADLAALGLPVLGEIPRRRRSLLQRSHRLRRP